VAVVVAAIDGARMSDDDRKNGKNISAALTAASCALLGGTVTSAAAQEMDRWTIDSALLYYGESDDRVQDVSATISAKRDFDDDHSLGLALTADTLTGASASGAIALDSPQTFTSPSGNAVYTTAAREVPLDDTFLDTRFALNTNWTQPLGRLYTASAGLGFSTEYDYTHLAASLGLSRDFNKRNTTLSLGLSYSQDDVEPVGGAPIPLSQMLDVGDASNKLGTDSKDVIDLLLGATQVLNRTTVLRVNYSYSQSSGYLNDPYKILSVVDPLSGDTIARVPASGFNGPNGIYVYEARPDSRAKHSLYSEVKHSFGVPVLHLSYRFMTDDWSIDSHTLETRLRWPVGGSSYIEPQLRFYTQNEADFYRASLVSGQPLPEFASADFRLGNFDATTIGVKFGHRTASGSEWSTRLEYYQQSGDVPREQIIGNQSGREQYPDLSAVVVQFGYRFKL
jgi:hypothetical protein